MILFSEKNCFWKFLQALKLWEIHNFYFHKFVKFKKFCLMNKRTNTVLINDNVILFTE